MIFSPSTGLTNKWGFKAIFDIFQVLGAGNFDQLSILSNELITIPALMEVMLCFYCMKLSVKTK
jgi:hypothetical protein